MAKLGPGDPVGDKYVVEKVLASGGMGMVVKARHEVLDHPVAIKIMHAELMSMHTAAQRFLTEARAAARINSDYVARVTDVDLIDGETPYMVMDFLEGRDLEVHLQKNGPLDLATSVDVMMEALAGLDAAHKLGLVHRDLKPANLFLADRPDGGWRVKVLDFGISKVLEKNDSLAAGVETSTQAIMGTPRYMAPEQARSAKTVDRRADFWSIGMILYELLAGMYPFPGITGTAIFAAILTRDIQPLSEVDPAIPAQLSATVARCVSRKVEKRPDSARELMMELAPYASARVRLALLTPAELAEVQDVAAPTERRPEMAGQAPSGETTKPGGHGRGSAASQRASEQVAAGFGDPSSLPDPGASTLLLEEPELARTSSPPPAPEDAATHLSEAPPPMPTEHEEGVPLESRFGLKIAAAAALAVVLVLLLISQSGDDPAPTAATASGAKPTASAAPPAPPPAPAASTAAAAPSATAASSAPAAPSASAAAPPPAPRPVAPPRPQPVVRPQPAPAPAPPPPAPVPASDDLLGSRD